LPANTFPATGAFAADGAFPTPGVFPINGAFPVTGTFSVTGAFPITEGFPFTGALAAGLTEDFVARTSILFDLTGTGLAVLGLTIAAAFGTKTGFFPGGVRRTTGLPSVLGLTFALVLTTGFGRVTTFLTGADFFDAGFEPPATVLELRTAEDLVVLLTDLRDDLEGFTGAGFFDLD